MNYSPVSIQFRTDNAAEYSSGMYICDGTVEHIVSVCPHLGTLMADQAENGELLAALKSGVTDSSITWDLIELVDEADMPATAQFFQKFRGFAHTPLEMPKLYIFRFKHRSGDRRQAESRYSTPLSIATHRQDLVSAPVRIVSCPFGDANPALFIGYQSQGVVSHVSSDCRAMLVDARFLDKMSGAILVSGQRSLGLVYGQLTKSMGQGRLVTAIPWSPILEALGSCKNAAQLSSSLSTSLVQPGLSVRPSPSVVVVNAKLRAGQQVWGSGVLVAPDIVVTNKHVPGSDFMRIEILFEDGSSGVAAAVSEPLRGVDLVLLKLRNPVEGYSPVFFAASVPDIGSPVTSYGYGLVHPGSTGDFQPLYSSGNISSVYMGKIYKGQGAPECSMVVSTASCWNGSSGGGVFNQENELVGIMASNARDEQYSEIMPDMAFVIPVNIVQFALECVGQGQALDTTQSYQKLWNLEPTHVDSKRTLTKL